MKLPSLFIAAMALGANAAATSPINPGQAPSTAAAAGPTVLDMQVLTCVTVQPITAPRGQERAAEASAPDLQRVCTPLQFIARGHELPDLSQLRPVTDIPDAPAGSGAANSDTM